MKHQHLLNKHQPEMSAHGQQLNVALGDGLPPTGLTELQSSSQTWPIQTTYTENKVHAYLAADSVGSQTSQLNYLNYWLVNIWTVLDEING